MKTTTPTNRRRAWLVAVALASLLLLVSGIAGITPAILGGLPIMPAVLGLSYSLTNLFF